MVFKVLTTYVTVSMGFNALWMDADIVLFKNPVPHLRYLLASSTPAVSRQESEF
jgi:hypothetical protein